MGLFKSIVATAITATIAVSAFPIVNAATLTEPIHVNPVNLDELNQTYSTDEHVDSKGIGDGLTIVNYTASGNYPYIIQFDMTIETPLFAGSTDKAIRNAFGVGLANSNKSVGEGGYFQVSASTDTSSTIIWKTSSTASLGTLQNNHPYRIMFTVGESAVEFTAVDLETGNAAITVDGLGLRNATTANANVITVSKNARENGVTDSVKIENAVMYDVGPDEINASLDGQTLNTTSNTIAYDPLKPGYNVEASLYYNGEPATGYNAGVSLVDANDHNVPFESDVISYKDGSILIDGNAIETGSYDFAINAYERSTPNSYVSFPMTLTVGNLDPEEVIKTAKSTVSELTYSINGEPLSKDEDGNYIVDGDINLNHGSDILPVEWKCEQSTDGETWVESDEITSNGVVMPHGFEGQVRLVASLSYKGVSDTVTIPVKIFDVEDTYITPNISEISVTSVDDATVKTKLSEITDLDYDIQLPKSLDVELGNMDIKWTASTDNILIDDKNVATIHTSDLTEHQVNLIATFVYSRDNTELIRVSHEYPVTVGFTESDLESEDASLDKYKVRFDAEYEENFEDIPTTTSSDIELPTKGMFGSTIKWTSNAPSVISNNGSVTRQNSNRDVTLTASIMSGAVSETKTFDVTVRGKSSSSSSSGGGGGGSVSSVGGSSNVNTGGAIAGNNPGVITTPPIGQEVVDELVQQKEEAENRFTDIGSVSWARDAINSLYDAGIINGKTETTFAPNDNVTRAEFAKMLMGVFGLNSDAFTTSSFYDVSPSDWYFQSVESAYNLGIINGVAPAYFDPNANITRQDMAVMVVRAATVSGKAIPTVNEAKTFADEASIADYAKDAVSTLQVGGIIDGVTDTTFAPTDNATRAQAAKILYSFL